MSLPKLGVVLRAEDSFFRSAKANDPCDVVILRSCLLNPPRRAAAIKLRERLNELYPEAELWPVAWHYVSHRKEDGLQDQATRTLEGTASNFGHLQATPEVETALETTLKLCQELGAGGLVLKTPASFSSGNLGQTRLQRFVDTVKAQQLGVLWQPDGLWTPERAGAVASMLDIDIEISSASATTKPEGEDDAARWARTWLRVDGELRPHQAEILVAEAVVRLDAGALGPTHFVCDGPRAHANLRMLARELETYA